MTSLLSVRNIDAYYGRAKILSDLSIDIGRHERVALVGRNGVGKTTLVNALLGIASVPSGTIAFGDRSPRPLRHYHAAMHGIAVVPQGRRIIPKLSVREHMLLGGATGRKGHWTIERVFDLFPVLRERADKPATALSGGQQQMAAMGRALMSNPALLILDEPTEGLAPIIVDELVGVLKQVRDAGTGILLVEQNLNFVFKTTDRFMVMSKGQIATSGKIAEVSVSDLHSYVAL
jgi:branched-chain amino acid transport system ATP-binding protein